MRSMGRWPAMVRSRRLRGQGCEHVCADVGGIAACYVPDTPSIEPKLARVLGLYPPARMITVYHAEEDHNTAVGGPRHGGRMVGISCVVFSLSKSSLRDEPAALFCNLLLRPSGRDHVFSTTICTDAIDSSFTAGWLVGPLLICGGWV